jgi:hypothetical protein
MCCNALLNSDFEMLGWVMVTASISQIHIARHYVHMCRSSYRLWCCHDITMLWYGKRNRWPRMASCLKIGTIFACKRPSKRQICSYIPSSHYVSSWYEMSLPHLSRFTLVSEYFFFNFLMNIALDITPQTINQLINHHIVYYTISRFCLGWWCLAPLSTIFHSYRGGNRSTRRKPSTCRKSPTNFIT